MNQQEDIIRNLQMEKAKLESIIQEAEERMANAPAGSIRMVKCRRFPQFYLRSDPSEKSGKYIPAGEKETIRALVQKKYDAKMIKNAKKQLGAIDSFLSQYDPQGLDKAFQQINPDMRNYLSKAIIPNEEYALRWQAETYEPKPFAEGTPEHYTQRGERVRSKSEVLIANALYQTGIPYRYEAPLYLGRTLLYPDFTTLRVRDRKIIYMEHFGLLDDASYRDNAISKVRLFERNGILPGDRLLITVENYRNPLNLNSVNALIHNYLL